MTKVKIVEMYMIKEGFVKQYAALNNQGNKESVFGIFMDKMDIAEKSIQENGYYSEEEVEEELDKI